MRKKSRREVSAFALFVLDAEARGVCRGLVKCCAAAPSNGPRVSATTAKNAAHDTPLGPQGGDA
jgi:hypothetical protein